VDLRNALQSALDAANAAGDVDTVAAIAGILKRLKNQEPEAPAEPEGMPMPTDPEVAAEPTPEGESPVPEVDEGLSADQQAFYNIAQAQITEQYPEHEVESVNPAEGTITIVVPNTDTGVADTVELRVEVAEDGTVTVTEQAAEEPAPREGDPDDDMPIGLARHPIMVAIGPKTLAKGKDEAWVNVVNLGSYQHPIYGELVFTEETVENWRKNLAEGVIGGQLEDGRNAIAVDYGHSMDDPEVAPHDQKAAGYITDLKVDGEKVLAYIEFAKPAAQGIRDKEWAWFSVSFSDDDLNARTGESTGPILGGGAITNRPFIPGLQAIQLTDLRPTRTVQLQKELAKERAEVNRLKREAFESKLSASKSALESAGIPPAVITLAMPVLKADFDAEARITLSRSGKQEQVRPGEALQVALLELAKVGRVPTGENTGKSHETLHDITLAQAIETIQAEGEKEGKSIRHKDAILLARQRYPHLRSN
jgi:hypothetical protein